ncbi:MAG: hypothetical protein CMN30_11630 [Sandaracinus sp.]|nr:hypothetical protein [Sandaracinus sp.]
MMLWTCVALSACGDDGASLPDIGLVDSGTDAATPDGGQPDAEVVAPAITAVVPTTLAVESAARVEGSDLAGVTELSVGGVGQGFAVEADGALAVATLGSATPLGDQEVRAFVGTTGSAPLAVTVVGPLSIAGAVATTATSVRLTFDRALDPATVDPGAFVIDGLAVVEVAVDGAVITLTTDPQTEGASYAVTAAGVRDTHGHGLTASSVREALFPGYAPMVPQVTEVDPTTVVAGHSVLTLRGENLTGAAVDLGGVALPLVAESATELEAGPVPASATPGSAALTVTTASGTSSPFTVTVLEPFRIESAMATGATTLEVTTNRPADPASVSAARFVIPTLTVTDAVAAGTTLTLTTSPQTPGASYAVGADDLLVDAQGAPVTPASPTFTGFEPPFPTHFVVLRVGDGSGPLSANAAPLFLERRRFSDGTVTETLALPAVSSGANHGITLPGAGYSPRLQGSLTRSPDGRYLALLGQSDAVGAAPVAGPRVVALVDAGDFATPAGLDTTTTLGTSLAGGRPQGAVTDGTTVWAVGGGTGILSTPVGSTADATEVSASPRDGRAVGIFEGQLFYSASGSDGSVLTRVGTGMPTGSATTEDLFPAANPIGFAAFDLDPAEPGVDTFYVASRSDGVVRYVKSGGTWAASATFAQSQTFGVACYDELGDVVCVAVAQAAGAGELFTFRDAAGRGAGGAMTSLATAPADMEFRGVALAPRP